MKVVHRFVFELIYCQTHDELPGDFSSESWNYQFAPSHGVREVDWLSVCPQNIFPLKFC
jgi:hypothetical protein